MSASKPEWSVAFVLPNLRVPDASAVRHHLAEGLSLGQDGIAIVPADDPRVREIRARVKAADILLGSFRGEHGERHRPAALIIREDIESKLDRDVAGVVAFRNAVAMSFVLPGRALFAGGSPMEVVSWTDFFDFHPTTVSPKDSLYTSTPAFEALLIPEEKFQAMPSTGLKISTQLGNFDGFLVRNLGRLWSERFLKPRRDKLLTRLVFRALEIAYHAASMTNRNEASLNDYGLQVALWVTALEVLARPPRGNVSQHKVLALLEEFPWDDRRLNARRYTLRFKERGKWKYEHRSIAPKLCNNLYQARHRFVHGDATTVEALTPAIGSNNPPLPAVAALVFRAALTARLMRRFKRRPWSLGREAFSENLAGFEQEQALLSVMGLE